MKTRLTHARTFLLCLGVALGCNQALAGNVTIEDEATMYNGFTGNGSTTAAGSTSLAGLNAGKEDQETERVSGLAAIAGQTWDLEAYYLDGKQLSLIGGYNFLNGLSGGRPGDLFIAVGGAQPTFNPTTNPTGGLVANSTYGYKYAIDLSLSSYPTGSYVNQASFGTTASVKLLNGSSVLRTVENDKFGSNPWKYESTAASTTTTGISYATNVTDPFGLGLQGTGHNVLTIDLSFMGTIAAGTNVWFSYTMECGNDSMKGYTNDGFTTVPDSASSLLLLGLGFSALGALGYRRSKA